MSPTNRKPEWDSRSIQALRRHLGLTQRQMADELGTRQQTISEWETGLYQPRGASAPSGLNSSMMPGEFIVLIAFVEFIVLPHPQLF